MKNVKTSSLYRLVAFLLITILLIATVGLVADGWQNESDGEQNEDKPGVEVPDADSGTAGESLGTENNEPTVNVPELPKTPEYINYLTGLETTEEQSFALPSCFLLDSSSPLYGLASSPLLIELPTEGGGSRLLMYSDQVESLGKIGSIYKSRGYMANVAKYFGGIYVHAGEDDTVDYESFELSGASIDLSKSNVYSYSESNAYLYSNGNLMTGAIESSRIPSRFTEAPTIPFTFSPFGKTVSFSGGAKEIMIPYGEDNEVTFLYSNEDGYIYQRNGNDVSDLLSGETVAYGNVFILFADAVTYEKADGTQLVLDTVSGGSGYYFTGGTMTKILWSVSEDGVMLFTDTAGVPLVVNRANSYIGFYKISEKRSIEIQK